MPGLLNFKAGIPVKDKVISLSNFCSLQLRVNGRNYPSLNDIVQTAAAVLHPNALASGPLVFGLGDFHGQTS